MKNNYDFITIPRIVVQSDKIRDSDRIVYGVIYSMAQMSNLRCTAKNTTIADMAGLSTGSVANSLTRLVEANFIKTTFKDSAKRIRVEIIPLISYNNEVFHQVIKQVSSNDESGVSSNDEQNNNYIYNNNINNIISELYKINNKIYIIGKTKLQKQYLEALLKCPPDYKEGGDAFVEHVEHIIQWYVSEYKRLEQLNNDDWKFLPKATVPSKLVEKWNRIEQLYNESHKEHKSLW